mgnify:CR=1 FL=1
MLQKFRNACVWIVLVEFLIGFSWFAKWANRPSSSALVQAVRRHESNGDEQAIGDKKLKQKAYTSLQIRQPALDDVNKFFAKEIKKNFGREKFTVEYLKQNRAALDWCFEKYTSRYATRKRLGRSPTDEDRARIWNGGPDGYKKASTTKYWKEGVRPYLLAQT